MPASPTPAERAIWRVLRQPPFKALHFRRQVPFEGRYIADLASHEARLVVEVDGPTHAYTDAEDLARTAWLVARGYRVVRISNSDVLGAFDLARTLAQLVGL